MLLTEIKDALSLNLLYANSQVPSSIPSVLLQPHENILNKHEYYFLPMVDKDNIDSQVETISSSPTKDVYFLLVTMLGLLIGFSLIRKS